MMEKEFDVVIIGSGLGGLVSGAILSKAGYSVCVLEKQKRIGGNLQTFKRKGKEFDTGMHYFGVMEKGQILHKVFTYLGIIDQIHIQRLDMDGFERIRIGDDEYKLAQGYDAFEKSLIEYFPEEEKAIQTYVEKLKAIWQSNGLLNFRELSIEDMSKFDQYTEKVKDFVDQITDNPRLRAVLTANNGLYAGQADKTPLYIHAIILNSFIQSAWRLSGGGSHFADALKDKIEELGGQVLTGKEVVGFEYEGKSISAVMTAEGERYPGKKFISNLHPAVTVDLVEEGKFRKAYVERMKGLENSISSFTLYLNLKPEKIPHLNANTYYSPEEDVWGGQDYDENTWPRGFMMYTTEDTEHPGFAESLTAISYMKYEEVQQWEETKTGKRGEDYEQFKKEKAEKFIDLLEKIQPDVRDAIETSHSATPLTYKSYTGIPEGSMYGVVKNANDPLKSFISNSTRIPNLFLTGQNIMIHGMLGTTMSALLTCAYFTDINELMKKINQVY